MGVYGPDFTDNLNGSLLGGNAGAFGYGLAMYGAELQGRKSFGGRTSLLYSFGGGAANSIYAFTQGKAEAANGGTGDVGYSLFGSLGVDISMTRNLGFYIKAIAKYYNIPASSPVQINNQTITLPHANAFGMDKVASKRLYQLITHSNANTNPSIIKRTTQSH